MGRKKYNKQFLVRLTAEELEVLESRAKEKKMSISRFLVESGLAKDKILDKEEIERQERAIYHVRKIGVNINQIAYALNRKESVAEKKIMETMEEQKATLKTLKEVMVGKK